MGEKEKLDQLKKQRIFNFMMNKKIDYGKAIYIVGNRGQLGNWEISSGLRLSWNQGNIWTTSVIISTSAAQTIQFKYIIANWNNPLDGVIEWEAGESNRKTEISQNKYQYTCQNNWNMEKIDLYLFLNQNELKNELGEDNQYYLIGNCKQLGNWTEPKKMNKPSDNLIAELSQKLFSKADKKIMHYCFQIYRGKTKFHYYFMKKSNGYTIERHPGRKYEPHKSNKTHTRCLAIYHNYGDTQIYQQCKFEQLVYSKVTERIFLGAYLKNTDDLDELRKQNINSVLCIQTQEDFVSHSLTSVYLENLCHQKDIDFYSYSIEDMNKKDFIDKSVGALKIMSKIMQNEENKIYVHCSAGVYRSAQIVVLYLALACNYDIASAIKLVKQRHPVARPNQKIVQAALLHMTPKSRAVNLKTRKQNVI